MKAHQQMELSNQEMKDLTLRLKDFANMSPEMLQLEELEVLKNLAESEQFAKQVKKMNEYVLQVSKFSEKASYELQMKMKEKEAKFKDLKLARLADPEMRKKEIAYKKLSEAFYKSLITDNLVIKGESVKLMLTEKELTIDGKKQSRKLFKKYTKLLVDIRGEELAKGKKFILNF